jgi:hypothetical protein
MKRHPSLVLLALAIGCFGLLAVLGGVLQLAPRFCGRPDLGLGIALLTTGGLALWTTRRLWRRAPAARRTLIGLAAAGTLVPVALYAAVAPLQRAGAGKPPCAPQRSTSRSDSGGPGQSGPHHGERPNPQMPPTGAGRPESR